MLEIKNLTVEIEGKIILENIDVSVEASDVLVLFGPNGSGKSTLIKAVMGFSGYNIKSGSIFFKGKRIDNLSIDQRVKMGLGIMYQHPPVIRGVKLEQIAGFINKKNRNISDLSQELSVSKHLNRDINLGFSGGEMKRSELFQLILQDPDLLLLDEPESGVDLENISLMGKILNDFLSREGKAAFVITHTGYILDYLDAKKGCILIDKRFSCVGNPKKMFESIKTDGYEKCKECRCHQVS